MASMQKRSDLVVSGVQRSAERLGVGGGKHLMGKAPNPAAGRAGGKNAGFKPRPETGRSLRKTRNSTIKELGQGEKKGNRVVWQGDKQGRGPPRNKKRAVKTQFGT